MKLGMVTKLQGSQLHLVLLKFINLPINTPIKRKKKYRQEKTMLEEFPFNIPTNQLYSLKHLTVFLYLGENYLKLQPIILSVVSTFRKF